MGSESLGLFLLFIVLAGASLSLCSQQKAVISHRLDKKVSGSYIDARQAPKESIFRLQTFLECGDGLNSMRGRMNEILTFQHGASQRELYRARLSIFTFPSGKRRDAELQNTL